MAGAGAEPRGELKSGTDKRIPHGGVGRIYDAAERGEAPEGDGHCWGGTRRFRKVMKTGIAVVAIAAVAVAR